MKAALLNDRGVIAVTGEDARRLLNGLLTTDITRVAPGTARFAALLTPQGKIAVDGFVAQGTHADALLVDCPRALTSRLVERLNFYKLRAKAHVEDVSDQIGVLAVWDGTATVQDGLAFEDPRLPALGLRVILSPEGVEAAAAALGAQLTDPQAYEAHRIALGVPSGGIDFAYGDAYPHEADMDQLHGVDFDKGCYVGQEVVSRMEHRGRIRTRVVPVSYAGNAPQVGAAVRAGGKAVGTMGSAAAGRGLGLLRLDRVEEALTAALTLEADGISLKVVRPSWARFSVPGSPIPGE
ncbi:MAG TPA: folate-binding protein [Xanthobacteraceae bacterium]|nr:folate-binding protein [Xanthobacteraceae bacterium]